ncbi:hypothetical protein G3480_23705 [Thiorhodococcus mannitoliphagus]|uniref:Uncharacterized protein n=1 Tax=Thiorhodococcus mannitoliphagus TaxID=329406 RepID=A0A6P1E2G6_9GAMM|nr:hypothetical protein [Thiorhodococcus mannitoliphagus]NEX23266.1 hypothetical protein [Thiorhodococcus mannitoliphagus]
MRQLIKLLSWTLSALLVIVLGLAALLALDSRPQIPHIALTSAERAWVKAWIATNRPSANRSEGINRLTLTEKEANLLLNGLLDRAAQGRATLDLQDGAAEISASLRLPLDQVATYLNLRLKLIEDANLLKIESARVAGLPIPAALAQKLAEQAIGAVARAQVVQSLEIEDEAVSLSYAWRPHLLEHLGSSLVAEDDLPDVLSYQAQIQAIAQNWPRRQPIALSKLLSELLATAAAERRADPVDSNRTLIIALTAYVNGKRIRAPSDDDSSRTSHPRPVTLRGRRDLSQHFMTSAALTIEGSDALSNVIGWYKELSDSDGGSGFSFADMTANRAGIRFAKLATENAASARRLQQLGRAGLSEDDFMPKIDGLPEGMSRSSFATDFGDPDAQTYKRMILHIDRRIDSRPLFRPSPG